MYVSPKTATEYYKVSETTLRNWANNKLITFITTEGGHRRYYIPDKDEKENQISYVYARVSSRKQEGDLERQVTKLRKQYPKYKIIQDIGSGINFQRPGFKTLVEQVISGKVKEIVVTERDRFTRCGFEFFEGLFSLYHTQIIVMSASPNNPEKEFIDNLMSIITVFTSRYYGKRHGASYTNDADKDPSDNESETAVQ